MGLNPTKTFKEKLLVSASASNNCTKPWWSKGMQQAPAPCPCQVTLQADLWHQKCLGGTWGTSARLSEGPGIEIVRSSQDGSLKMTWRRVCPALKAPFVLQLWLKESSSWELCWQSHWMIGRVGISQGCVTAPETLSPCQGSLPPQILRDFLLQEGSVRGAAVKAGIKLLLLQFQGLSCPAHPSRGRTGSALCSLPSLGWISPLEIHYFCFFTCKMSQGAKCPAKRCCHPWDKGLSPESSQRSPPAWHRDSDPASSRTGTCCRQGWINNAGASPPIPPSWKTPQLVKLIFNPTERKDEKYLKYGVLNTFTLPFFNLKLLLNEHVDRFPPWAAHSREAETLSSRGNY